MSSPRRRSNRSASTRAISVRWVSLSSPSDCNEVLVRKDVTGHSHGIASIIHVNLGADCDCDREICTMSYDEIHRTIMPSEKTSLLRQAMLVNGVDLMGHTGGAAFMVSSAHNEELIDRTLEAFAQSLGDLKKEGALQGL